MHRSGPQASPACPPPESSEAAEIWGTVGNRDVAPRPRDRAAIQGCRERVCRRSTSASPPASSGKPGCGVSTITGQGNGQGGREHGHKCDQLPGNRDITNPEHRAHVASVWGCDEAEIPGKGIPAAGDHRSDPRRQDQGTVVDLLQPGRVRYPTRTSPPKRSTSSSSTASSTSSCPNRPTTPTSSCPGRCTRRTRAPAPAARGASSRSTQPSSRPEKRDSTGRS